MRNAAAEVSEINNLPFGVHSFPLHPPLMRAEPTEAGREEIQTDRHAWEKREGDPDKEEINMGRGD